MTAVPTVPLNNGVTIPQLGLGTARLPDEETRRIVREALEVGYRFVDTAASYENERGVGQGIADSGLPREEVFVSTKLRGREQGSDSAKEALRSSLDRLRLDHVDLYLIHWPLPRLDRYVASWLAMEELLAEGLTRAIGVSNFLPEHLDRLAAESTTVPAVNQIECHPRDPQLEQRADDARRGIVTESWSPLANGGELLRQPVLAEIGEHRPGHPRRWCCAGTCSRAWSPSPRRRPAVTWWRTSTSTASSSPTRTWRASPRSPTGRGSTASTPTSGRSSEAAGLRGS
jgi:2,5-diketo-D-gluconate reductase A